MITLPAYLIHRSKLFPKLLQKSGLSKDCINGEMAFGKFADRFTYWEIVPGQGDYYNPDFITQNQ